MTAKSDDKTPPVEVATQEVENENGEVIDEALLNSWVVGVVFNNPGDPDGPEGPLRRKSSKG